MGCLLGYNPHDEAQITAARRDDALPEVTHFGHVGICDSLSDFISSKSSKHSAITLAPSARCGRRRNITTNANLL